MCLYDDTRPANITEYSMNINDTIAAISTPHGKGGVAVIRISGTEAIDIAERVFRPKNGQALRNLAPNLICAYVYELAGAANKFYHETPILKEENEDLKAGYIALMGLTKEILEKCIDLLGFEAPEKM